MFFYPRFLCLFLDAPLFIDGNALVAVTGLVFGTNMVFSFICSPEKWNVQSATK